MNEISAEHDQAYQELMRRLDACIKLTEGDDQLSSKERTRKFNEVELAFESLRGSKTFSKAAYLKMCIK